MGTSGESHENSADAVTAVGTPTPASGNAHVDRAHAILDTPIEPGEIIAGRYRVDRLVAEGGMGIIVAATHLELDETVAIKFLKHEFAVDRTIVGRFAREAKAAARLKSEYTPAVHDVGVSPTRGPFIVMEFLEGEDFENLLRRERLLAYPRAIELIMQACVAIAVAHAHKIIHRDIKPANLFLVKGAHGVPIVKVLDFGVSKAAITGHVFGGAISLVKTQSIIGSPAYMSPEQLRGTEEADVGADLWSLGAVLYELITGRTPFRGATVTDLFASMLEQDPPRVSGLVPGVPQSLSDAIGRCFAKNRAARWPSVADFAVAIAPYAPERARLSLDRIVSISKSAGLVSPDMPQPVSLWPGGLPGSATPIGTPLPSPALPKLFQTMVDTHSGLAPPESRSGLPRLNNTMVDTQAGQMAPVPTPSSPWAPSQVPTDPSMSGVAVPQPRSRGPLIAGAAALLIGLAGAALVVRRPVLSRATPNAAAAPRLVESVAAAPVTTPERASAVNPGPGPKLASPEAPAAPSRTAPAQRAIHPAPPPPAPFAARAPAPKAEPSSAVAPRPSGQVRRAIEDRK